MKKKIIFIGGGKGLKQVLSAAVEHAEWNVTAIVTMMDDGGSSGELRKAYAIPAPGDVRRALIAVADVAQEVKDTWEHRFTSGPLKGHVVGNVVLAGMLERMSATQACEVVGQTLSAKAQVLPVTDDLGWLRATLEDGAVVEGESAIDEPKRKRSAITQLELTSRVIATRHVIAALKKADAIVLGPGDLFTSVLPSLLVSGVVSAIRSSKAPVILFTNTFTKYGETDGYTAADFVTMIERHTGKLIDVAVVNTGKPSAAHITEQKKLKRAPVKVAYEKFPEHVQVVRADLIGRPGLYTNGKKYMTALRSVLSRY